LYTYILVQVLRKYNRKLNVFKINFKLFYFRFSTVSKL